MLVQKAFIVAQEFPNLLFVLLENSQSFLVLYKRKNAIFARKDTIVNMELSRQSSALKETTARWDLKSQLIVLLHGTILT